MALRFGPKGPCPDVRAEQKVLAAFWRIVESRMARIGRKFIFPCVCLTIFDMLFIFVLVVVRFCLGVKMHFSYMFLVFFDLMSLFFSLA